MLIKHYGKAPDQEVRYSPSECLGTESRKITGSPDPQKIATGYVERNNMTMRMGVCAVALHFMYYKLRQDSPDFEGNSSPGGRGYGSALGN